MAQDSQAGQNPRRCGRGRGIAGRSRERLVRFWDASALVPTFLEEPATAEVQRWQSADPGVGIWMMTRVEVISAIARRKREQPERTVLWQRAIRDFQEAAPTWTEIFDAEAARFHAERIVVDYP